MVQSKLESPKGLSSGIYNAFETTVVVKSYLHKWYTESIKFLIFGKNFERWLFLKIEFSNYQTMIKAYINMPYKEIGVFSHFEKKFSRETEKIQILCIQDYVMQNKKNLHATFFFGKCLFE